MLTLSTSVQHGDLHAGNMLVRDDAHALLIDFGDVGRAASILDAVMLEFSLLFHPDSPFRGSPWPRADQAERWWDLDAYVVGCPVEAFVRACRKWAVDLDQGSLAAVVYVHAVRQLKYDDVAPDLALRVARGAVELAASAS